MEYAIGYLPHAEGDYNQNTPYTPMAVVHLDGESFIAKVNVPTGIIPRVSTNWTNYWQPFAAGSEGSQGYVGAQGAVGAQGPAGSGGGGGEGTQGPQGATGAQGTQGPAGSGGGGEPAQERKPGLLVVQGNIKSAVIINEKHDDAVTVPIWYDQGNKQHVVDVLDLEPALKAIGFEGAQGAKGAQGNTGNPGAQGATGAQGDNGGHPVILTQAEYDELVIKDPTAIYIISDSEAVQGAQGATGAQGADGSINAGTDVWTFNLADGTTITRKMYYEEVK